MSGEATAAHELDYLLRCYLPASIGWSWCWACDTWETATPTNRVTTTGGSPASSRRIATIRCSRTGRCVGYLNGNECAAGQLISYGRHRHQGHAKAQLHEAFCDLGVVDLDRSRWNEAEAAEDVTHHLVIARGLVEGDERFSSKLREHDRLSLRQAMRGANGQTTRSSKTGRLTTPACGTSRMSPSWA